MIVEVIFNKGDNNMSSEENNNTKNEIKSEKIQKQQVKPQLPKERDLRARCSEIFSQDVPNNKNKKNK